MLADSGTYTYSRNPLVRQALRGTAAHNAVRVDGQDSSRLGTGRWLWLIDNDAQPFDVEWQSTAEADVFVGSHSGYRRLVEPVTHTRSIRFDKLAMVWRIEDALEGTRAGHALFARIRALPFPTVGAINGASIARKTSFLRDRLGQQLFAKNIRIIDDPLRVRGLRSQTFDAEGVRVKSLAIVDSGVLTSWLLDSATARELGLVTTGHAHRGVSSSPSPGPYNLHLEPGEVTPKELISDIAQGFYVTDLIGSGVNGVTGDYSRGASGFWIENGNITYPVSEVTIAGHLLEMFKSLAPANDLEFRYGVNAPTVRIEGLTLGGR